MWLVITDSIIFIRHQSYHNVTNRYFFILAKSNLPVYCIGNLKDIMSLTKYFNVWDVVFVKDGII